MGCFKVSVVLLALYVTLCLTDMEKPKPQKAKMCSAVPDKKDLSLDKFQGEWFASFQIDPLLIANPACNTLNISTSSPKDLKIDSELWILNSITLSASAKGTINNLASAAVMDWEWDFVPGYPERAVVVETDYDNFAVIVCCDDPSGSVVQGYILSRSLHIKDSFLKQGKEILSKLVDISKGKTMQVHSCHHRVSDDKKHSIKINETSISKAIVEMFEATKFSP